MDFYTIFREPFSEDQQPLLEPIRNYFRGHACDDAAYMREAFLPGARIESMREGVLTTWPLDLYCERFKGTPAVDEKQRERIIDWIDVSGSAACARVTLEHGATRFVDYFLLLKTEDGWKISSKAFHGQPSQI